MFRRFRDGLFAPSQIINYKNDNWLLTILFFILLVIISTLPNLIYATQWGTFNYEEQMLYRNEYKLEELPFEIEDYKLNHKNNDYDYIYKKTVANSHNIVVTVSGKDYSFDNSLPTIVITRDSVLYKYNTSRVKELFSYTDYKELENLDLELVKTGDYFLWSKIFTVVNQEMKIIRPMYIFINLVKIIFYAFIELVGFSLLLTVLQKFSLVDVSFLKLYKLIIYAMSPYVIGQVLYSLYGLNLFVIIGLIMTYIYSSKIGHTLSNYRGK